MQHSTFSPTVMLMDDDPAVLDIAGRRFNRETSLGIIVARDLVEARRLVDDKKIHFNAIVADIAIMPDKQDAMHHLWDGIDLLNYTSKKRKNLSNYVLSVYSNSESFRKKTKDQKVNVKEWFQKLDFSKKNNPQAPWHIIERDLYRERLEKDAGLRKILGKIGEDDEIVSDAIRKQINPMIRTYIQAVGDESYQVIRPIEVICRFEEGVWLADALHLGLLQAGGGESREEAIDHLSELIVDQFRTFHEAEPGDIEGYTSEVFDVFKDYIGPKIQ